MRHFRSLLWTQTFLLCFGSALAEESPASGRVVDAQGKPVSGTTVRLVQEKTQSASRDRASRLSCQEPSLMYPAR